MAAKKKNSDRKTASKNPLSEIKERLRAGKITKSDLRKLEKLISDAEAKVASLRAAVVE